MHVSVAYGVEAAASFVAVLGSAAFLGSIPHSLDDILLLLFGALLPNKLGIRTGSQAGALYAPVLIGHYSGWLSYPDLTNLSQGFVQWVLGVLGHQRLVFGVIGGLAGALAFMVLGRRRRVVGNVAAGVAGAAICTWSAGVLFFINLLFMRAGHPQRFEMLFTGMALGTVLAVGWGVTFGLAQRLCELLGCLIRRA